MGDRRWDMGYGIWEIGFGVYSDRYQDVGVGYGGGIIVAGGVELW
jgi:hypothetical protein